MQGGTRQPRVLAAALLCGSASAWAPQSHAAMVMRAAPVHTNFGRRAETPRLQFGDASSDELDGWGGSVDGGTMFAAWDGRDSEGISPEGAVPPGEDLIEKDLRRVFDLDAEEDMLGGSEMEELQLMYNLRKELGDEDFRRIFEDRRVKGPEI